MVALGVHPQTSNMHVERRSPHLSPSLPIIQSHFDSRYSLRLIRSFLSPSSGWPVFSHQSVTLALALVLALTLTLTLFGRPSISRVTLDQSWTWAPFSGLANSPDLIWPARGPFPSLSLATCDWVPIYLC